MVAAYCMQVPGVIVGRVLIAVGCRQEKFHVVTRATVSAAIETGKEAPGDDACLLYKFEPLWRRITMSHKILEVEDTVSETI